MKNGTTAKYGAARADFEFLALLETDDCVVWTNHCSPAGYGRMSVDGRSRFTHEVALARRVGPKPAGLVTLHSCDNPPCMNYRHLSWGTNAENLRQWVERRTHCVKGHPVTPGSVALGKNGCVMCQPCKQGRMMRRRSPNPPVRYDHQSIIDAYKSGLSLPQISTTFGIDSGQASRILKANNVETRSQRSLSLSQEAALAARLRVVGYANPVMAEFGVSRGTVSRIQREHGVVLRSGRRHA